MTKVKIWRDGEEVEIDEAELGPRPEPIFIEKTKLYKSTIWRRCTDEEYNTIQAVLSATPPRIQAIFRDADHININDELYPMIVDGATQAVGAERAAELLEPEE